jgi:hypothetical protein
MPFDWNGYLELAETLTKVEANESALRTAIIRFLPISNANKIT